MTGHPLRSERARRRVEAVTARLVELRALMERLRAGAPVTPDDVEVAERRAVESATMADQAYENAAAAHARAADAHRAAAKAANKAGDDGQAHRHEDAAVDDDSHAVLDLQRLRQRPSPTEEREASRDSPIT